MFLTNTKIAKRALNQTLASNTCVVKIRDEYSAMLLSDLHFGSGNDADDANDISILNCLQYCLEKNIQTIILNGDIFEGWESDIDDIIDHCLHDSIRQEIIKILQRYADSSALYYNKGNHEPEQLKKLLEALGLSDVKVTNSILLKFYCNQTQLRSKMFVIHGHQADGLNYCYPALPKFFVKWLWTPIQKLTGLKWGWPTPAKSKLKQNKIDNIMMSWTASNNLHTIIGHTHQPQLNDKYYNIGCGVYKNNEITSIELSYKDNITLKLISCSDKNKFNILKAKNI
jgi:UDP-2,3-diacylglucosamine pyrophosphatase LpxH